MRKIKVFLIVSLLVMGIIAISPVSSYAQGNTMMGNMNDIPKAEVAISGYCPVCLLSGMKNKGSDNFTTEYKGKIYKFGSIGMQKAFIDDPEKYTKDVEARFAAMSK